MFADEETFPWAIMGGKSGEGMKCDDTKRKQRPRRRLLPTYHKFERVYHMQA